MSTVLSDDQAKRNISANVNAILNDREWSQRDLAAATAESDARISLLVRGIKLPTAGVLARVAEALGTTVDALLSKPHRQSPQRKSGSAA